VSVTKEAIESNKPIKFEIISQPSIHNLKLSVDPIAKTETITTNFLILWYGTLVLVGGLYLISKLKTPKTKKVVDSSSDI
jgi:hypothetical protein